MLAGRRCRPHRPRRRLLPVHLHGDRGDPAGAARLAAGRRKPTRRPTSPTASRRSRATTRPHLQDQERDQVQPAAGGGTASNGDVTSADVKYAIERGLLPGVANGYEGVVPRRHRRASSRPRPRPRRTRPWRRTSAASRRRTTQTIVFKLTKPTAPTVDRRRCRCRSARRSRRSTRSSTTPRTPRYGEHQVGTGPVLRRPTTSPGKEITLERNPNWDPYTDWRPAYLDKIDFQEGFSDTVSAGKKILTGSDQVNGDFSSEPEALKQAATQVPRPADADPVGAATATWR